MACTQFTKHAFRKNMCSALMNATHAIDSCMHLLRNALQLFGRLESSLSAPPNATERDLRRKLSKPKQRFVPRLELTLRCRKVLWIRLRIGSLLLFWRLHCNNDFKWRHSISTSSWFSEGREKCTSALPALGTHQDARSFRVSPRAKLNKKTSVCHCRSS